MSREPLTWHTGGDSGPHKPVHERTTDSQFGTSHGRRHPTLPRANLSREEPDAGNPHVRVCEGWGRQRPHLLGRPYPRKRDSIALRTAAALPMMLTITPRPRAAMWR